MLKYLVEEKGADIKIKNAAGQDAWTLAVRNKNVTYIRYLSSFEAGTPLSVADLATSDEWGPVEAEEAIESLRAAFEMRTKEWEAKAKTVEEAVLDAQVAKDKKTKEAARAKEAKETAAAKALLEEQEAKAKEATAALLAELDAEDRQAAAGRRRNNPRRKATRRRGREASSSRGAR
jgi:hypothetical protein